MLNLKVLFIIGCLVLVANTAPGTPGGETTLKGAERKQAIELLRKSLRTLAAGDGPSYRILAVLSVTSQVVSGTLYKYNVVLVQKNKEIKICNVSIWSQPWLENGNQITIKCPGEPDVQQSQSP